MTKKPSHEKFEQSVKKLDKNEALRALLNATIESAVLINIEGKILAINQVGAQRLGKSADELIGVSVDDYFPPDVAKFRKTIRDKIVRSGKPVRFQDEREGRVLDNSVYPVFDVDNKIIGIAVYGMDITERKRVEEALHKSKERYALAVVGSTDGLWDWDISSDTVYFSNRFKELLGYLPEEFPGSMDSFQSHLHPEDADVTWTAVERHLKGRIPYNVEYRLRVKSGEYRWFLARGQAIWDREGNPSRMAGSISDVTARKQAKEELLTAYEEIKELKDQLEAESDYLQEEIKLEHNHENIIGNSEPLKYVLYKLEQAATIDSTVLILGETGTGKELIARAIHRTSLRHQRPLVKVNCATLPINLIESELFGHEKGAFTGATAIKTGRFELANNTTLFLDEIGELPLELQAKMLRAVEDGEFERLGGSKTIKVNVRIIAATNRNLEKEMKKGRFREDLWYRLNVFPITMPPLRERKDDIPSLVNHFVDQYSRQLGKSIEKIPRRVIHTLQGYHWPGNIRELKHVIERAVISSSGPTLRLADSLEKLPDTTPRKKDALKPMAEMECEYILRVLDKVGWKVEGKSGAAEVLDMNPGTLRSRMKKLGIRRHKGI
jgi:formate hydrogenlyase transcriptional activator